MEITKENIERFLLDKNGNPSRNKKKQHSTFLEQIILKYPHADANTSLYMAYNDVDCKLCRVCKGQLPIKAFTIGWGSSEWCSKSCMLADGEYHQRLKDGAKKVDYKERAEKTKATYKEKYGVEWVNDLPSWRESFGSVDWSAVQERVKQTTKERYGVEHWFQTDEAKRLVANVDFNARTETIRQRSLEKYGVPWPAQAIQNRERASRIFAERDVIAKREKTSLERYGALSFSQTEEFKRAMAENKEARMKRYKEHFIEKYGVDHPAQVEEIRNRWMETNVRNWGVPYPAQNADILEKMKATNRERYGADFFILSEQFEQQISKPERAVGDFVTSLGLEWKRDRSLIHPLELDVYIPSHKLAFEINGVYWHGASNAEEDRVYRLKHRRKTEAAEAAGIRLVHLTDVEINTRWDTVSSMIESMLGASPEKIPARKCSVIEVPKAAAKAFLEENHIQGGGTWCHLYLGLVHEDRLVAVMGFDKARFDRSVPWELTRFANLRHTTVIGGFSKLLAHFEKDHEGSIVSYADYSRSQGNVYLKNGFERISISQPSYRWVSPDGRELFNRHMFMRRNLARVLTEFREEETEAQNCFREGYRRLWDCGQVKFIKKR